MRRKGLLTRPAVVLISLLGFGVWSCQSLSEKAGSTRDPASRVRPIPFTIDEAFLAAHGLVSAKYVGPAGSDANSGATVETAFATIQKGIDSARPGDIVYVLDGVYTAPPSQNVANFYQKSGTAEHWIMLAAYPGHRPKVKFIGWDGITVQGSSYIIVSGFLVEGNAANISLAYAQANASTMANPANMGSGITVTRCWDDKYAHSTHVIIANNTVYGCSGGGIATNAADYVAIRGNLVCYNSRYAPNATSGISLYQNWNSDATTGVKMIVSGNVSFGNYNDIPFIFDTATPRRVTDGNGIIVDDAKNTQIFSGNDLSAGAYRGQTLVANNICFGNGGRGLNIYESSHVTAANNTLYFNLKHPDIGGGELTVGNSDDLDLIENIVVSRSDKVAVRPFQNYGSTGVIVAESVFWGGTLDSPANKGNLFAEPRFINATTDPRTADFHLRQDSPARGLGALP